MFLSCQEPGHHNRFHAVLLIFEYRPESPVAGVPQLAGGRQQVDQVENGHSFVYVSERTDEVVSPASLQRYEFWPMPFTAVVDGGVRASPLLPGPLATLTPAHVPVIIGTVPNESLLFSGGKYKMC